MKRYFYPASRAHHAYCMALDFGMEFERRFGKWDPDGLIDLQHATQYKIYIHPDSLHLLEPQVGDVVLDDGRPSWCSVRLVHDDRIVIQRNGIAFHWPESEEV